MAKDKTPPQAPATEQKLQESTPDNSREAANAADPNKKQSYLEVFFPIREGRFVFGHVRSDFIAHFGIDTNSSTNEDAVVGGSTRKAYSRSGYTGGTDTSADSEQVAATVVARGNRSKIPRGKVVRIFLGTATEKGTLRTANIAVPGQMSAIEVANWIDTCFKQKKPNSFRMGSTTYPVKAVAKEFSKLRLTKSMKGGQ